MHTAQIVRIAISSDAGGRFFYFHGMYNGDGFHCWNLANHIGPEFEIAVVHPHGFNGLPIPRSIRSMAASIVAEITAIQPHGPYYLGGFCVGGLVAFEVAQLLRKRGEQVAKLIVISAGLSEISWLETSITSLLRFLKLNLAKKLEKLKCHITPLSSLDLGGRSITDQRRLAYERAYRSYRPAYYDSEIICVWGDDDMVNDLSTRERWGRFAASVITKVVSSDRFCVERNHLAVSKIIRNEILNACQIFSSA